jgi:hypothetical protein
MPPSKRGEAPVLPRARVRDRADARPFVMSAPKRKSLFSTPIAAAGADDIHHNGA